MRAAPAVVLIAVACGNVTPPERPQPYEYGIGLVNGFQIVFHWTPASLPVRVWTDAAMRAHAADAIRLWEGVSLYGEFRGIVIQDSTRADVIMRRAQEAFFDGDPDEILDCSGTTSIGVELDTTITLPFRITFTPRAGAGQNRVAECLAVVAAHELGHALGLFQHSAVPEDLMHARPTVEAASLRDRTTFATLYHSAATVGVPRGR